MYPTKIWVFYLGVFMKKKEEGNKFEGKLAVSVTNGNTKFHINAQVNGEAEAQIKKKLVFRARTLGVTLQHG